MARCCCPVLTWLLFGVGVVTGVLLSMMYCVRNGSHVTLFAGPYFQPWEFYEYTRLYSGLGSSPFQSPSPLEFSTIFSEVARVSSAHCQHNCSVVGDRNGYVRRNRHGYEYILDVVLSGAVGPSRVGVLRTVRPLYSAVVSATVSVGVEEELVNFLVPVWSAGKELERFVAAFERELLIPGERVRLVLIAPAKLREHLAHYREWFPSSQLLVVAGEMAVNRTDALVLGASRLPKHALLFLTTVDVEVQAGFLDRCRSNTVWGQQVYRPGVFKVYNMAYVYAGQSPPPFPPLISRSHGHWYYLPTISCIYQADFAAGGGVALEVLQAPDVGVWWQWRQEDCPRQEGVCWESKFNDLADRRTLAQLVNEKKFYPNSLQVSKDR